MKEKKWLNEGDITQQITRNGSSRIGFCIANELLIVIFDWIFCLARYWFIRSTENTQANTLTNNLLFQNSQRFHSLIVRCFGFIFSVFPFSTRTHTLIHIWACHTFLNSMLKELRLEFYLNGSLSLIGILFFQWTNVVAVFSFCFFLFLLILLPINFGFLCSCI